MTETAPRKGAPTPSPGNPGPHPQPRRPRLALPRGSTDSHCHVFGPGHVFPYAEDRPFTPPDAPREQVASLHDFLGFDRAVLVQSSCHGTDHAALLDALRSDPDRLRGVAILGRATSDDDLDELHAAGVRGARLHFLTHLGSGAEAPERNRVVQAVATLGWHAEVHVSGSGVTEQEALITRVPGPVVIDHMARVHLSEGLDSPAVRTLVRLLDRGNVWVKLSGVDRISLTGPPYFDGVALAALLAQRFPERVLWGTDYPHVNIQGDAPDDGLLVDLIEQIAPDAQLRERLLVTNPAEVFDF